MLLCLSTFFLFLSIFFLSYSNFNIHSLYPLFIILLILVIFFSNCFTLSQGSLFFDYISISHFSIFSNFNFIFSFIVLLVCVILLGFILAYFKWFYFIMWFLLLFFLFFFSISSYVISFNYILMFLFWELMGVCWFFLISAFFFRIKTRFASFVAFFWNLSGDFALLLYLIVSIILYWTLTISFNYYFIVSAFFLVLAIFAKSAVFPLHTWLYYAMEGPTPVSAFLHAAWMITAGVYLFFIFPIYIGSILYFFSLFWILFFSFNAIYFYDLKRIIASWTGSQMGYIFLFFSLGYVLNGLLLFWYHAVFKSYFFFLAGFIISSLFDYQDFRSQFTSFSWFFFLFFCWVSLVGLFFFWTGIIKEIFVYKYLGVIVIKFSFFFIFIFWCIYSFKLFIIRYAPFNFDWQLLGCFLYMFGVLFVNIGYTYLNWTVEYPLYYFSLSWVFAITSMFIILLIIRIDFYSIIKDFVFNNIFLYFYKLSLILYFIFYDIYIFCNFFFTFY